MAEIEKRATKYADLAKRQTFFDERAKDVAANFAYANYCIGATEQKKEDLEVFLQFLTDYAKMICWEVEAPSSMKPLGEIFRDIVQARIGIVEDKEE